MQVIRTRKLPGLSRWFDLLPSGTLRMKRVSAEHEAKFPRAFRLIYQKDGAVGVVKAIRAAEGCDLTTAWNKTQSMLNFND